MSSNTSFATRSLQCRLAALQLCYDGLNVYLHLGLVSVLDLLVFKFLKLLLQLLDFLLEADILALELLHCLTGFIQLCLQLLMLCRLLVEAASAYKV